MLERHEVEAFLTLAEELHFGRTAELLGVSTGRVSQTITKLERRIGVPLFDRTSRRVALTPVGARLYGRLQPAWDLVTEAVEEAIAAGRGLTGKLKVAFLGAAGGQLVARAADAFRERHPDCEVVLAEAQLTDVAALLGEGEIDIALGLFPVGEKGIAAGPVLVSEARMLAVPAGHPFARRTSIPMADVARVDLVQGRTFHEVLTQVGAGRGAFVVGAQARRYYPRPDVAYVPIDDAPPLQWGLLWRADAATARVRAFAQAAYDLVNT